MKYKYFIMIKPCDTKCEILGVIKLANKKKDIYHTKNNISLYNINMITSMNEKYITLFSLNELFQKTFEIKSCDKDILKELKKFINLIQCLKVA